MISSADSNEREVRESLIDCPDVEPWLLIPHSYEIRDWGGVAPAGEEGAAGDEVQETHDAAPDAACGISHEKKQEGLPPTWKEARAVLPEVPELMSPWPKVEIVFPPATLPDPEAVEGLVADCDAVRRLLELCRTPEYRTDVAQRFIEACWDTEPEGSILLRRQESESTHFWVVGDIHASLTALAKVWAWILFRKNQDGGRHVLIFTGDILDRGKEDLETVAFILSLYLDKDNEVFFITGNHDAALGKTEDGGYTSSVSPSETKDRLNSLAAEGVDVSAQAEAAMLLARISPRMIEICGLDPQSPEKTVMLVHGGVPHTDRQEELYRLRDEIKGNGCRAFLPSIPEPERSLVAEDFTWLRFSDNLPYKRANRNTRGCEIGTDDVNAYRQLHYFLTGRAVACIIRGHDHERAGYRLYSYDERYNNRISRGVQRDCTVLTINTMEPAREEMGLFCGRQITVAHLRQNEPLTVYVLPARLPAQTADDVLGQTDSDKG